MQAFYCIRREGKGGRGEARWWRRDGGGAGEESSYRGMQRRDWNSLSSSLWHVCRRRVCFLCLHWKKHTQSHMHTHAHSVRLQVCAWRSPLVGSVFFLCLFFSFLSPYSFRCHVLQLCKWGPHHTGCCAFYHTADLVLEVRSGQDRHASFFPLSTYCARWFIFMRISAWSFSNVYTASCQSERGFIQGQHLIWSLLCTCNWSFPLIRFPSA